MDGRCERHQFEAAIGLCDFCGEEFCGECLVHPFGEKRPPLCIPCTISQSGLRASNTRRRKLSRKERKEMEERITTQTTPTVLSATEAALMSAGKPGRHASAATETKEKKRGLRGKKKDKGEPSDDTPTIKPVVATPSPAPSSYEPTPEPAADDAADAADVPSGVGMTAPGAEEIDWSKPFEIKG